jgi:hypothetical protein
VGEKLTGIFVVGESFGGGSFLGDGGYATSPLVPPKSPTSVGTGLGR